MQRSIMWLIIAVLFAVTLMIMMVEGSEQDYDYSKRMREESRRDLPKLIEMLHSENPPMDYEFIVLRISYSEDPRAIEPMMEVLADTMMSITRGSDPYVIAARFLGKMGDKRAIPILKKNLELTRHFLPPTEYAKPHPEWDPALNAEVRLASAAALWQLGELQEALTGFRAVLSTPPDHYRKTLPHLHLTVDCSLTPYQNRPEALDTIYQYFREATRYHSATVKIGAARRLVGVDNDLAFVVAEDVVSSGDEDASTYYAALGVLKTIGGPRVKSLLKSVAENHRDEAVRAAAQAALREMSQEER